MRPRSQCSSSGLADERRAATVLGRLAERSIDPQKRAVFRPQLCKITNQFATLDSSFAVSTLRLPDARWSSLVARRAHNPKVGGSNPPRATTEPRNRERLDSAVLFCAVVPRYQRWAPCSSEARPRSAQALDGDSGSELRKLSEIVLIAGDDEVAAERGRGDDCCVDRVGAGRVCQQLARAFGKLRCQRFDATAF